MDANDIEAIVATIERVERELRIRRVSRNWFCQEADLHPSTVARWLAGDLPTMRAWQKYCRAAAPYLTKDAAE